MGDRRQPPRRLELRRSRSLQRHRRHARIGPRHRRAAPAGLAAQADHRLCQLGCRGGGPDRLNRVGGAERPGPGARRGLLQHRRRRLRRGFLRLRRALAQAVSSRTDPLGSQPAGRHGLSAVAHQASRAKTSTAPLQRSGSPPPAPGEEIHVGDLGSGSDFTPFFQHVGVPSTDIGSEGPYGVYHSVFDNFAWFTHERRPGLRSISSRWPASSALRPCAWPTPTCCPTTMSPMRARSAPILMRPNESSAESQRPSTSPPPRPPPTASPPPPTALAACKSPPPATCQLAN